MVLPSVVLGLFGLALLIVVGGRLGVLEPWLFYFPRGHDAQPPVGAEEVRFPSATGGELHAWWLPAKTETRSGSILYCHGNAFSIDRHLALVEALPALGYDVLLFDYRCYGQSPCDGRPNRERLIADARGALDYLTSRDDIDQDRLFLLGHSMGSMVASNLAADLANENTPTFRAVALVAPFSSFPLVANDFVPVIGNLAIPNGRAPEEAVAMIKDTPLLIVHGDDDTVVRPYHGTRVLDAATAAGVNVTIERVPDNDHISILATGEGQARVATFFDNTIETEPTQD